MNIPILTKLSEAKVNGETCEVEGIILSAGISENGTYYSPEVVESAAPIFRSVQCYADHPRDGEIERSVRDVVGVIEEAWPDDGTIRARIKISRAHDWLITMVGEGLAGDLSINALGKTKVTRRDGRVVREVLAITKAHSVDFVARAAAGGRVDRILKESAAYGEGLRLVENISIDELSEARPDLIDSMRENIRREFYEKNSEGESEIRKMEREIERRRFALKREIVARFLLEKSGLPVKAREFLLTEALSVQAETDEVFESAVEGLISRHRIYLANLSCDGSIRGMGSGKLHDDEKEQARRETRRLMGLKV
ncbi:MAG: hypothetical protein ABIC40_05275 [bacterium]